MSLLQKASIITTPTAYAEDYLYSIKPALSLGSEEITNGNFNTNSNWTVGSTWEIDTTNKKAKFLAGSNSSIVQTGITFFANKKYEISFNVLDTTSARFAVLDQNGVNTYVPIAIYTNGFFKTQFKPTANRSGISIAGSIFSGGTTFSIDNISVKEITDADFEFDRNSTGTRVNEDYLIEDVPYNAINFSEDFTQWSLNGDSVVLQDETYLGRPIYKLTEASSSTLGVHQTRTGNIAGSPYTISLIAKKDTSSFIRLRFGSPINKNVDFNLDTGVVTSESSGVTGAIQNIGNGFYQLSSVLASLTNATISYAIYTSNGSVFITSAQMVKGDKLKDYLKTTDRLDIPRIDYTNGEPSILLEPSRTNNIIQSTNFNGWNLSNVAISSNAIASPEGINNASKIYPTSTTTAAYAYLSVTGQTTSIYAKKGERNWIMIYGGFSDTNAYFNLDKGEFGTVKSQVQNYNFISYPNDWYRINITYTSNATQVRVYNVDGDNNLTSTPNGTDGIYIYGAQNEAGSYATSLIHTSGSAVTRSADAANNAGNSDLFNDSEGVLYAQIKALSNDGTFRQLTISDSSTSDRVSIDFTSTDNQIRSFCSSGGGTVANMSNTVSNAIEFNKVAVKYKLNDYALYINGSEVATDTSGAAPIGLQELAFDNGGSSNDFYGNVKMIAVFKEALSDTELEKLTGYNNHELYMNYYNRLSYLGLAEEYNVESDINNYIL